MTYIKKFLNLKKCIKLLKNLNFGTKSVLKCEKQHLNIDFRAFLTNK